MGFSRQKLRGRQHYFCCFCNIQIIFHLLEPQIKRAMIMSQCMPTGMGHPLLMFLKQLLYHILYQGLREKQAIWNWSWPERQNTWFMSWPCFYTAEWPYAKKQLNPSRALFPTHKRHKSKNGKSRKNLWIKDLLRSISMYRMEMYLGLWDWILELWRKYLCNFGRSTTEQIGIIPHR